MSEFEQDVILPKALSMVWSQSASHRYQPRAVNGGPEWDVWDMLEDRSVPPDELVRMMPDQVQQKITQ